MRFFLTLFLMAAIPLGIGAALSAQSGGVGEQSELRDAKKKASIAQGRSERLRQEAANANNAADRLLAQRAVLSADMDAANAQILAARARIKIIEDRQKKQLSSLGEASAPILRLNAALQKLTSQPVTFLLAQPGSRKDYIRLRAVMDAVSPYIESQTSALRQQIAIQKDLRNQQNLAVASLTTARSDLKSRRTSLAALEKESRGKAGSLNANAALEFERSIAQGERARDIVEEIDTARLSSENAAALADLDGPVLRAGAHGISKNNGAYLLPENAELKIGVSELNVTGYRERGLHLSLPASTDILAPATGKVAFAGDYRDYGNIIIIEHGEGWATLITNLGQLNAEVGQSLEQGTVIGQSTSDGGDISIELRRKGRIMDIGAMLL